MPRINLLLIEAAGKFQYAWIKKSALPALWPEQTRRAQTLLWALPPRLLQVGSAGGPKARLPGNRPDSCKSDDARRGQEKASLPESQQVAPSPICDLRRFQGTNQENWGPTAWSQEEQFLPDPATWSLQLLLCSCAVWWAHRAPCWVLQPQCSRGLPSTAAGRRM